MTWQVMIAVTGGPTPLSAVQMYVPASGKMYVQACEKMYVQASGSMIGNDYHAVVFACQNSINFNKNYHSLDLLGILRHFLIFLQTLIKS